MYCLKWLYIPFTIQVKVQRDDQKYWGTSTNSVQWISYAKSHNSWRKKWHKFELKKIVLVKTDPLKLTRKEEGKKYRKRWNKFLGLLLTTVFLPEIKLCRLKSRLVFVLLFGVLLWKESCEEFDSLVWNSGDLTLCCCRNIGMVWDGEHCFFA